MNKNKINAIQDLYPKLDRMMADIKKYSGEDFNEDVSLKVRPGYGYDKFYLDWVEGSYDMSLQSLINFMLQDHKHYKKLLSKETYKKVTKFNKQNPTGLCDFGDNIEEQELIDSIEFILIHSVKQSAEKYGFSIQSFIDARYEETSPLSHISKFNIVGDVILNSYRFTGDLYEYISNNKLTEDDIDGLMILLKNSGGYDEVGPVLYEKYPDLSKDILKLAIAECTKKSECSMLIANIKKLSNDKELINEALAFKEKL